MSSTSNLSENQDPEVVSFPEADKQPRQGALEHLLQIGRRITCTAENKEDEVEILRTALKKEKLEKHFILAREAILKRELEDLKKELEETVERCRELERRWFETVD